MKDDTTPKWSKQDFLEMATYIRPNLMSIEICAKFIEDIHDSFMPEIRRVLVCPPEEVLLHTSINNGWASKIVAWRLAQGR